jgi:phosphopantothenate synthetase
MFRRIAPRLLSGRSREKVYSAMPRGVKNGLKMLAQSRGLSVSYMMEQDLILLYKLKRPAYRGKKV